MHSYVENPKTTRLSIPVRSATPGRASFEQSRKVNPILNLQRTIGNQAVRQLLEGNSFFGTKVGNDDKTPPKQKIEPKTETKPAPAQKPTPPTISSMTTFGAPDGTAKTRTNIGVGEEVKFTSGTSGKWTATSGTPLALATAATFNWTAPNRTDIATIKLELGSTNASLKMNVLEPARHKGREKQHYRYWRGNRGSWYEAHLQLLP